MKVREREHMSHTMYCLSGLDLVLDHHHLPLPAHGPYSCTFSSGMTQNRLLVYRYSLSLHLHDVLLARETSLAILYATPTLQGHHFTSSKLQPWPFCE